MGLSDFFWLPAKPAVPATPQTSEVLTTGAVPPLTKLPRAWKSLAQRGSLIAGTLGGPRPGVPGGRKGMVAPGQRAATLTMAGTGALSLMPAKTKGAPFSSRLV